GTSPRATRVSVPRLMPVHSVRTRASPSRTGGSGSVRNSPEPGAVDHQASAAGAASVRTSAELRVVSMVTMNLHGARMSKVGLTPWWWVLGGCLALALVGVLVPLGLAGWAAGLAYLIASSALLSWGLYRHRAERFGTA